MTLIEIQGITKEYADAYQVLVDRVTNLNGEIETIKRRFLPGIKSAIAVSAEKMGLLKDAIDKNRDLFDKPRTHVFHGIKIGIMKNKGKIQWEDDDQVVKLIRKNFPEKADILLFIVEKPSKTALDQLPAADLKKIGVQVIDGSDVIMVKPADSNVDKIVSALLKDTEHDQE